MTNTETAASPRRKAGFFRVLFVWPILVSWRVASGIETSAGIIVTLLIAAFLLAVGLLFTSTLVGIVIGVPMMAFGTILLVRAIY